MLCDTDWSRVDAVVLNMNEAGRAGLLERVPRIGEKTRLIDCPRGVELAGARFVERKPGKRLACIGDPDFPSGPALLLQCMKVLCDADAEYSLHVAGSIRGDALETYLRTMADELGLSGRVTFDGHQADLDAYLADKQYIVSTALFDGIPLHVLEGMARGLKPVVHAFPGSRGLLPDEHLFRTPEEFRAIVTDGTFDPSAYRRFVETRFSLRRTHDRINELLMELEADPVRGEENGNWTGSVEPVGSSAGREGGADD
jgi:hypothetical protein